VRPPAGETFGADRSEPKLTVISPPPALPPSAAGVRDRRGLDPGEAEARLAESGPNRIAAATRRSLLLRFLDQFRSALVLILLGAAVLAALVGDLKDPIVIGLVVLINAGIGLAQERKAERSLEALRSMLSPVARVRRAGVVREVDAETVVPGDIVVLEAGERVPADARLLLAVDLEADESALTGESVPALKSVEPVSDPDAPVGERNDRLFMHTVVTRGRAEALVEATGMQTEVGRLAALLHEAPEDPTPLQRRLERLGHRLAAIAGVAVALMMFIGWMRGTPTDELVVSAVALAVAAIPEGLPAVVAVTLALGARRMAGRRAIVKRLASVETLGSTTVVCSDKTGTLTQNRMTAALWWGGSDVESVPVGPPAEPALARIAEAMVLANDAEPPAEGSAAGEGAIGDPTEIGLLGLAGTSEQVRSWRSTGERVGEVPFDSAVRTMSVVWRDRDGSARVIVKGALDAVLARCSTGPDGELLGTRAIEAAREVHDRLAAEGHRVLAAASGPVVLGDDDAGSAVGARADLQLLGLVGLVDPARPEARDAIAVCHRAGIAVKMITGDHAVTARAIASDLGIRGDVVSGAELDDMTPDALANRIDGIGVFARVAPEHKVRIVRALRERGEIVAMTGDGVNDAPALRHADIGVAMGRGGTEVAKEAAALVLTDDSFSTIVGAVGEGRTIFANIGTFVRFQLSTNLGAITSILGAAIAGLAAPFTAIQLLWVNLIMDGPPAIALGVDPASRGTLDAPPRHPDAPILGRRDLLGCLRGGALMAFGTLGVLVLAPDAVAPTMAFTTFVLFQVVNALSVRTERGFALGRAGRTNPRLWGALAIVTVLQVAAVQVPALQGIFDTVGLGIGHWLVVVGLVAGFLLIEDGRRIVTARMSESSRKGE